MKARAILFGQDSSTLNHKASNLAFNNAPFADDCPPITFGFLLQNSLLFPLSLFISQLFSFNFFLKIEQFYRRKRPKRRG